MSLPDDVTVITVTAAYLDMQGNAQTGTVTFTPAGVAAFADAGDGVFLGPAAVTADLAEETGEISVTVPVTDAGVLSPVPFQYTVTENILGLPARTYAVSLPSALGETVSLPEVAPAAPVPAPVPPLAWSPTVAGGSLAQYALTLTTAAGFPYSIGGATWEYVVAPPGGGPALLTLTGTADGNGVITVETSPASVVTVSIYPLATATLGPGSYAHALWMDPGTASAFCWATGTLTVTAVPQP